MSTAMEIHSKVEELEEMRTKYGRKHKEWKLLLETKY